MNESIRELILKHASAERDKAAAVATACARADDGWLKVRRSTTTVAEVVRVTQDE